MAFKLIPPFKAHKETESKVHEQLYKNVALLTYIHPTSNEFKTIFKKDMFVKKNSAAFQQVVYFLLSVLDPIKLKQKVITWPIYDARSETQFRTETIKYLNELNGMYEDANLPAVLMSHVVSPGGSRFAKYMLKLSQLVLMEHLKRQNTVLLRIHPNKGTNVTSKTVERLESLTQSINEDTEKLKSDFEAERNEKRMRSEEIVKELTEYCKLVPKLRKKLEKLQTELNDDSINLNMIDSEEELVILGEKLQKIVSIREKSDFIVELISSLLRKDLFFEYKPGMFPEELTTTSEELNLLKTLQKFNLLLDNKCLDMKPMNNAELQTNIDKFNKLNGDLLKMSKYLQNVNRNTVKLRVQLQELKKLEKPKNEFPAKKLLQSQTTQDSAEVLACPLDSSGESTLGILHFED